MQKYCLLSLLLCTTVLSGCASMFQGSDQNITISAINDKNIDKTRCNIKNEEGLWTVVPNAAVSIHRDGNDMEITCDNGIQTGTTHVEPNFSGGYLGLNLLLDLCTISCVVDGANNAFYQYPPFINVQMNDIVAPATNFIPKNTQSYYPAIPTNQSQPVQPVVEQTSPNYQIYQQPQSRQSGKDLRYCLGLVDNQAIAECVRKAKR